MGNIPIQKCGYQCCRCKGSGEYSYQLSFLEEGDYEVCLVAYDDMMVMENIIPLKDS
ncbi:MAG: hypothetical protein R3B93_18020 [Bacteroidia bacterium]